MTDFKTICDIIDEAVSLGVIKLSDINYEERIANKKIKSNEEFNKFFAKEFSKIWLSQYDAMITKFNEILEFSDGHYECFFDYNFERVVCFFGVSQPTTKEREKNRQSGFLPEFTKHYPDKDRGHFLSHCQGGGMDVNFFPQNKEINRGWSEAGKIYRKMEMFCSKTPGIFCFSRPLYDPESDIWVPQQIEYGIAVQDECRAVVFPN